MVASGALRSGYLSRLVPFWRSGKAKDNTTGDALKTTKFSFLGGIPLSLPNHLTRKNKSMGCTKGEKVQKRGTSSINNKNGGGGGRQLGALFAP